MGFLLIFSVYFARNPRILHKLLVECGALYTAIEVIVSKDDVLGPPAALGITAVSKVLGIAVPKCDNKKIDCQKRFDPTEVLLYPDNDGVMFVAGKSDETENRVEFSESLLTSCSEVFQSMLTSDFRESKEKTIHLRNQTIAGVKYFLTAIKRQHEGTPLQQCDASDIGAVLESYDMCQVYLLADLERDIFNMILFMLSPKTILKVFEFSMQAHKEDLSQVAINYYLSARLEGPIKVAMYKEADDSEHFKEWNQLILDTVVYTCQKLMTAYPTL